MYGYDVKIEVLSEEESKMVQEKLFEMGYYWSNHEKYPKNVHARYLFASSYGGLTFSDSNTRKYFDRHDATVIPASEILNKDGKVVTTQDVKVLRKYVKELASLLDTLELKQQNMDIYTK